MAVHIAARVCSIAPPGVVLVSSDEASHKSRRSPVATAHANTREVHTYDVSKSQGSLPLMLTAFGIASLTFMMVMYAVEGRGRRYMLGFAAGCYLSSVYGFLSGAWPFGVIEAVWGTLAVWKYARHRE